MKVNFMNLANNASNFCISFDFSNSVMKHLLNLVNVSVSTSQRHLRYAMQVDLIVN